jgi:hypothetical protein
MADKGIVNNVAGTTLENAASIARPRVPAKAKEPSKAKVPAKGRAKATPSAAARVNVRAKASRVLRRDGTGQFDVKYSADLRARSRASAEDHTVDRAFLRKSKSRDDPLAEELGEDTVMTMTSAEDQGDQLQDVAVVEEVGGPFQVTTAGQEFARGTDPSNPRGATQEPFPST